MSAVGDVSGQSSSDSLVCNVNLTVPACLERGRVFSMLGGVWFVLVCVLFFCMFVLVPELVRGM